MSDGNDNDNGNINSLISSKGMTLGQKIKMLRERLRLSQRQLGSRVGVRGAYISLLESDKRQQPTLMLLARIADALGVSVEEFLPDELARKRKWRVADVGNAGANPDVEPGSIDDMLWKIASAVEDDNPQRMFDMLKAAISLPPAVREFHGDAMIADAEIHHRRISEIFIDEAQKPNARRREGGSPENDTGGVESDDDDLEGVMSS